MKKTILIAALAVTAIAGTAMAQTSSAPTGAMPSGTMPPSATSPSTPPSVMPSTTGTTAAATPTAVVIGHQKMDEALSSELIGSAVYAANGDRVGDVNDLVIDTTGRVSGVVIGVGGLLGVGEKNVAVDFATVTKGKEDNGSVRLTVQVSKDALKSAAPYVTAKKS